jgi:hypothetical protein
MAIEQLEKVLVRYDPVRGGPVVRGRLVPTSVHESSKGGQTTPKNWLRIRAALNVLRGVAQENCSGELAGF